MEDLSALLSILGGLTIIAGAIISKMKRSFWIINAVAWVLIALSYTYNVMLMVLGFIVAASSLYRWYRDGQKKR